MAIQQSKCKGKSNIGIQKESLKSKLKGMLYFETKRKLKVRNQKENKMSNLKGKLTSTV